MRLYARIFAALSVLVIAFAFSGCEKYYNYNLDKYVTVEDYEIADLPKLEEVTDEDVLNKIKGEFSSFVAEQVVTGVEIKEEDYVTVSVDCYNSETSKVIEELKYDALVVKVGSLYVAEGFSEKFIGCKSGDNVEFSLTLDESHEKFGLNGVEVHFVCLIKEHVKVTFPEFTDEFVKENSDFSSFEECYNDAKKKLEERNKSDNEAEKIDAIWTAIEDASEIIKLPEKELNLYEEAIRKAHSQYAADLNVDFSEYLENHLNMSSEEFEEFVFQNAEDSVKSDLIIKSTAEKYNIKLSEDEYKTYLETQREAFGFDSAEEFEVYYGELTLRQLALETKISEYLLKNYN